MDSPETEKLVAPGATVHAGLPPQVVETCGFAAMAIPVIVGIAIDTLLSPTTAPKFCRVKVYFTVSPLLAKVGEKTLLAIKSGWETVKVADCAAVLVID